MYGDSGGEKCMHSDHYDSREGAKKAAKQMGISGCHKQSCNGKTVYMPGSSHSQYMDAQESGMLGGGNESGIDPSTFGL